MDPVFFYGVSQFLRCCAFWVCMYEVQDVDLYIFRPSVVCLHPVSAHWVIFLLVFDIPEVFV